MLPSVAGVDITACLFDPAPLWLCVVVTAYVLNLRNMSNHTKVKVRKGFKCSLMANLASLEDFANQALHRERVFKDRHGGLLTSHVCGV